MKRILFIAVLAAVLATVGAVTVFAAPGGPGWGSGMMGRGFQGQSNGYGMMGRGYGHMGGYGVMGYGAAMHDDLEELLGQDMADIHAARVAGKTLVEIAAEKGVNEAKLTQALLDGRKVALDQAVEDGRLTQSQADEMLKFMEANIQTMVNAAGMGPGMLGGGAGGGAGGVGPCHGGQAPAQQEGGVRNLMRLAPRWLQQS